MEPKTKIGAVFVIAVILIAITMGCVSKESDVLRGLPEGNFTLLAEDNSVGGGTITKFHDDDSNVTLWIYRNCEQGGLWGCSDRMLTPPQTSNDYNCS